MEANLLSFASLKIPFHNLFKRFLLVAAALLGVGVTIGQVIDDFSDGDFNANPLWQGLDVNFTVNGDAQLQLDDTFAGQSYLSTSFSETSINEKEWQFWIKQSFSGSDNNHGRVYLAMSGSDLSYSSGNGAAGTGYFLLFGEGGADDAITLYRNDGVDTPPTEICAGTPGLISSSFEVRVLVRRDNAGNWEIQVDSAGGLNFVIDSSGYDDSYLSFTDMGVACNYTISNADNFYFDDFYVGDWQIDEEGPLIESALATGNQSLTITVNEGVTIATAENLANYNVSNLGSPSSANLIGNEIQLEFDAAFNDGIEMIINVSGLEDLVGNIMTPQDLSFTWVIVNYPQPGDLIINEIMPDPDGSMPSPNAEYVELLNLTETTLDITGITLNNGSFSSTTTIGPGEHLVVTDDDDLTYFLAFPFVVGMDGFPGLTNSGLELIISNEEGAQLDRVEYDNSWYQNTSKDEGGWSLELINPLDPCSDASNWRACEDFSGATVGEENSIHDTSADTTPPNVGLAINQGENQLLVEFSEPLHILNTASSAEFISVDGNANEIFDLSRSNANPNWLEINFTENGTGVYHLSISGVSDCWGNLADVGICTGFPANPEYNDVIINEVLFDPETGGSDYVELLNISSDVSGMKRWRVASMKDDEIDTEVIFTETNYTLCPGEYIVLTDNPIAQLIQYPNARPERMLTVGNLPNFTNENAGVMLFDSLNTMDWMTYDQNQHFDLIDDTDGVSLERIDPYWASDDNTIQQNWHSAAASDNYGTPGYINTQYLVGEDLSESLTVEPQIFSPDQDGYEDICQIHYSFDEPGRLANITIYSQAGVPIRQLAQNELLGTTGTVKWDGLKDDLSVAPVGKYVIYFETFNLSGEVEATKLVTVVAKKFQ